MNIHGLKAVISWGGISYNRNFEYTFDKVRFLKDFGPWKKGEKVFTLMMDFHAGRIMDEERREHFFDLRLKSPMSDVADLVEDASE